MEIIIAAMCVYNFSLVGNRSNGIFTRQDVFEYAPTGRGPSIENSLHCTNVGTRPFGGLGRKIEKKTLFRGRITYETINHSHNAPT